MISCAFCGRPNTVDSRFCIDCGKPIAAAAPSVAPAGGAPAPARRPSAPPRRASPGIVRHGAADAAMAMVPATRVNMSPPPPAASATCGWCGNAIDPALPYCAHCGRRTDVRLAAATSCAACGGIVREGEAFCGACGAPVPPPRAKSEPEVRTLVFSAKRREAGPRLAVLGEGGEPRQVVGFANGELTVGRGSCDLSFADDAFLSPLHAQFVLRDGRMFVRDLGSCNRTWVFVDEPHPLADDDVVLVGSQVLQFRRVGSPPPAGPESDGTRRIGSLTPGADIAVLAQLRADGSVRDCRYLCSGASLSLGRDTGDWTFPYDQTMSGRHAEIRGEGGTFVLHDLGSRNGVAVAVRGEHALKPGQRVLAGDQMLRVESV